jgi:hypothetical protein
MKYEDKKKRETLFEVKEDFELYKLNCISLSIELEITVINWWKR